MNRLEINKHILYINLEHRKDRNKEILSEFERLNFREESIERIDAVYIPNLGALGCAKSHIKALEKAKENEWEYVIIFEDDFMFHDYVTLETLNEFFEKCETEKVNWDVMYLACNVLQYIPLTQNFRKIVKGYTSSGYIIQKHYYDTILKSLRESVTLLEQIKRNLGDQCLDAHWGKLQQKDRWIAPTKILGKQRASFSDILLRNTNYGV